MVHRPVSAGQRLAAQHDPRRRGGHHPPPALQVPRDHQVCPRDRGGERDWDTQVSWAVGRWVVELVDCCELSLSSTRLYQLSKEGQLPMPAINIHDSVVKVHVPDVLLCHVIIM